MVQLLYICGLTSVNPQPSARASRVCLLNLHGGTTMRKLLTVLAVVVAMIAVVPLSVSLNNSATLNPYTTTLSVSGDNANNDNGNFFTTVATSTFDFAALSISLTPTPAHAVSIPAECFDVMGWGSGTWFTCLVRMLNEIWGADWPD